MERMNIKNKTDAFLYASYMMIGSCFGKVTIASTIREKQSYISYQEECIKTRLGMEDSVLFFTEEYLKKKLPPTIWKKEVKVIMQKKSILFRTDNFCLTITGRIKGNSTNFYATFITKKRWIPINVRIVRNDIESEKEKKFPKFELEGKEIKPYKKKSA